MHVPFSSRWIRHHQVGIQLSGLDEQLLIQYCIRHSRCYDNNSRAYNVISQSIVILTYVTQSLALLTRNCGPRTMQLFCVELSDQVMTNLCSTANKASPNELQDVEAPEVVKIDIH